MPEDEYIPEIVEDEPAEQETLLDKEIPVEPEPVIESEPVIDEPIIENADIIPDEPEDITEEHMNLNAIKEYPAYAVIDGKVKGLDSQVNDIVLTDTDDQNIPFKDFYAVDGVLYFSVEIMETSDSESTVVTEYYKQEAGEITAIKEADFVIPDINRVQMENGNYKIFDYDYHGTMTSRVQQGTTPTAYLIVDGYYLNESGLWFSVPEGIEGTDRTSGLYFYPVDGNIRKVTEYSRVF
jgi:hypothetical protein